MGPVSQRLVYGYQIYMCLNAVCQFGVTCIEIWPLLKHSTFLMYNGRLFRCVLKRVVDGLLTQELTG